MDIESLDRLPVDQRAVLAASSPKEANDLIEDFRPFISSLVSRAAAGYSDGRADDMQSVAMTAFYEAIRGYDPARGSFLTFAKNVVQRRLTDYIRKIYRSSPRSVSLEEEDGEDGERSLLDDASRESYAILSQQEQLKLEISQFEAELGDWGIEFDDLADSAPKHASLVKIYRTVVARVAASPEIMELILLRRQLPIKKISKLTGQPEYKLERARKFIIAALLIKSGDYEYLAGYVNWNEVAEL